MFITVTTFNEQRHTLNADYIIGVSHKEGSAGIVILSGYTPIILQPKEADKLVRTLLGGAE